MQGTEFSVGNTEQLCQICTILSWIRLKFRVQKPNALKKALHGRLQSFVGSF